MPHDKAVSWPGGGTSSPTTTFNAWLGGRRAEVSNKAPGDLDARFQRYLDYERDDMQARHSAQLQEHEEESPWRIHQQAGEEE